MERNFTHRRRLAVMDHPVRPIIIWIKCMPLIYCHRHAKILIYILFALSIENTIHGINLVDVSFSSEEDNFIGVIALNSPESTTSALRKRKVVTFQEEDSVVIISSIPQDDHSTLFPNLVDVYDDADDDDVSDPDEANYWYSALTTSFDGNQGELDTDDIPEISDSNDNTHKNSIASRNDANSLSKDQAEIKFYQLMVLMMLRHVFGSWLPGELDPWQQIFKSQLLQAQCAGGGGKKRKGFRTMMKRSLHFTDKKFEVVPQLQREDDNMVD